MKTVQNRFIYCHLGPVINNFKSSHFDFIELGAFENLRDLTLKCFDGFVSIQWTQFIADCPKLKTIDIELRWNQERFDFKHMVTNVPSGMKLTMRGNFKLTEQRLRGFKENSSCEVRIQVAKQSLMMTEEVFEEIMGEDKKMIEFL